MHQGSGDGSRRRRPSPPQRNDAMNTHERVAALLAIHERLAALLTPDEAALYPALLHLGDLIEDLQLDITPAARAT